MIISPLIIVKYLIKDINQRIMMQKEDSDKLIEKERKQGLEDIRSGKIISIEKVAKDLGIKLKD